jgi:hypothetical protein
LDVLLVEFVQVCHVGAAKKRKAIHIGLNSHQNYGQMA